MHIRLLAHGSGSTGPLKLDRDGRRSVCRGSSSRLAKRPLRLRVGRRRPSRREPPFRVWRRTGLRAENGGSRRQGRSSPELGCTVLALRRTAALECENDVRGRFTVLPSGDAHLPTCLSCGAATSCGPAAR